MKSIRRIITSVILTACVAGTVHADKDEVVEMGYFRWADAEFTSHVVRYILENKMGYEVNFNVGATAIVFQGVKSGDLDFHTDMWLPKTHRDYYETMADQTVNLGPMYTGARLGWAVPDYVPEGAIDSIEDLKSEKVKSKLDGKIVGTTQGSGLGGLSKEAMDEYGLSDFGYELVFSSSTGMTSSLKRAIQNKEWVVATVWSPHWIFGRWDLRYIDDPKGVLGGEEHADILARQGLYRDSPEVYKLLDRMTIPIADVQAGMDQAEKTSYADAAKRYVENHPELVEYWVTGELGS